MKKSLMLLPLVLVCASLPAAQAQAELAESGCRNIVGQPTSSSASWDRLLAKIDQSGDGSVLRPYTEAKPQWQDTGIVGGLLQLEAPSCSDVLYTAQFSVGETVLTTLSQRGDGTASRVSLRGILDFAEDCVQVVLTTSNPGGKVVDRAPDTGSVEICNGSGGGQTFGS